MVTIKYQSDSQIQHQLGYMVKTKTVMSGLLGYRLVMLGLTPKTSKLLTLIV